MVDAVHNIAAPYPASSRVDTAASTTLKRAPDAVVAVDQVPVASPRLSIDPVVGVIVQFLNSNGSVESQSPTFAAEAYIRAGLTPDGFSKGDADSHTLLTA